MNNPSERWRLDLLGICSTISGLTSGSGGDYSEVPITVMREWLTLKLTRWHPSYLKRMIPYDDAVRNLIIATLEVSKDK